MLVGSALCEHNILNFLCCSISCEFVKDMVKHRILLGYILTRTCDPITHHLGDPGFWCDIKLVDIPELGYTSKTIDSEGRLRPSGELYVRRPIICKSYFRNIEEAIDKDE